MRVVIQRVSGASVKVEERNYLSETGKGLLVLAAFIDSDTEADLEWIAKKITALRVFDDENGVMNLSVRDVGGDIMVVSQFTLYASTARGNRPSYIRAAKPDTAIPLYEKFCSLVEGYLEKSIGKGIFGADMKVSLLNDGPVTIIMDSDIRE